MHIYIYINFNINILFSPIPEIHVFIYTNFFKCTSSYKRTVVLINTVCEVQKKCVWGGGGGRHTRNSGLSLPWLNIKYPTTEPFLQTSGKIPCAPFF